MDEGKFFRRIREDSSETLSLLIAYVQYGPLFESDEIARRELTQLNCG
jgi:hypothetical protein